jgi:hypothetical protein
MMKLLLLSSYSGLWLLVTLLLPLPAAFAQAQGTLGSAGAQHTVTLLKGVRPVSNEPAQRVYYVSHSQDELELVELRRRMVDVGARSIAAFYPDVIVCEVPLRVDPRSVLAGTGITAKTASSISSLSAQSSSDLAWIKRAYDIADTRYPKEFEEPGVSADIIPPAADPEWMTGRERPAKQERKSTGPSTASSGYEDRLPHQNSEFLAGHVHIQVVFPESRPGLPEEWTPGVLTEAKTLIRIVTAYFEQHFRNTSVEFSYRFFEGAETQYEPIQYSSTTDQIKEWVDDVMSRMGYFDPALTTYKDKVNAFNNDARRNYTSADWVFTVFVVNSTNDPDHSFDGTKRKVYSELGGPFMVLPFPAGPEAGPTTFEQWFKFAMMPVFWGMTEDLGSPWGCGLFTGYLNVEHGNKVDVVGPMGAQVSCVGDYPFPCIAKFGDIDYGYTGPPCDFTMGHLGNIDQDRDNVPDIFNAAPEVIFQSALAETLLALDQPVRFTVVSRAMPNRNSQQIKAGVPMRDYATPIKDVTYTLNEGIGPFFAYPLDGETDDLEEEFELRVAFLHPGDNQIEVATRNGFGAKSAPGAYVKNIFYLGLEFYELRYEHRNAGVGLMWSLIGSNEFENTQLELHRIDYGAETAIDTVIAGAAELQSIGLDRSGLPQYYYHDKSAAPGTEYGYYVTGSFDFVYRGSTVKITSRSEEKRVTPAIPRTSGIMSAPVPNPYQPAMAEQELMVSVNVPGAIGISLLDPSSGINKAPSEGELDLVTVTVYVYDVAGRRIKLLYNDAVIDRVINVTWDGTNSNGAAVPSGVYFIKAKAGETTDARKVLIIR